MYIQTGSQNWGECQKWQVRQEWRVFGPEERPMWGYRSPYSVTNARNQIGDKTALESRGFRVASPTLQF